MLQINFKKPQINFKMPQINLKNAADHFKNAANNNLEMLQKQFRNTLRKNTSK